MGLESVAPRSNTRRPSEEHPVYPYLLRGLTITRPKVWATDITYIPLARGVAAERVRRVLGCRAVEARDVRARSGCADEYPS